MRKTLDILQLCFMLLGYVMIVWLGFNLTVDTYQFWKFGEEKTATVVALDRTSSGLKGGTMYYYQLKVEDSEFIEGFNYELPPNKTISVLVNREDQSKIVIGNADSTLFELVSYSFGGAFLAVAVLLLLTLVIISGPFIAYIVIKNWRKSLNY